MFSFDDRNNSDDNQSSHSVRSQNEQQKNLAELAEKVRPTEKLKMFKFESKLLTVEEEDQSNNSEEDQPCQIQNDSSENQIMKKQHPSGSPNKLFKVKGKPNVVIVEDSASDASDSCWSMFKSSRDGSIGLAES